MTNSLHDPQGLSVTPNGKTIYVADDGPIADGGSVYGVGVVDVATQTLVRTITAPSLHAPRAVVVGPSGADAYVLNSDATVSVIATATNTVTATIGTPNTSADPHGFAISPDGKTGYVSETPLGVVAVLNLVTHTVTRTITVSEPAAAVVSPDGKTLYVVTGFESTTSTVAVINTVTHTVTGSITGLDEIEVGGLALSPDGPTLYVAEHGLGEVAVIDTASKAITHTVGLSGYPGQVALSPDAGRLYVAVGGDVVVIDTSTSTVVHTVAFGPIAPGISTIVNALAPSPDGTSTYVAGVDNAIGALAALSTAANTLADVPTVGGLPAGVAVSPDGKHVYVADSGINFGGTEGAGVTVLDTATGRATAFIATGVGPEGVAVSPDSKTVYVTDTDPFDNGMTVAVIAAATNRVTGTITAGHQPMGVAISPNGARAYVANNTDNTVSVIDTAARSVINTITVGTSPSGVAVSPDGKHVYVATGSDLSVIDTTTNAVAHVADGPSFAHPDDVVASRDGKTVYASTLAGVVVVNTATNRISRTINTCGGSLALSPDGKTLYSTCTSQIEVINTRTDTVIRTISHLPFATFGVGVEGIAVRPDGKAIYAADADDNAVWVITDPPLSTTPVPTISGTAKVGLTLTAHPGTWGPGRVTLGYQWYANGAAIRGATRAGLKLAPAQLGRTIRVRVSGSETGFAGVSETSKATGKVASGTLSPAPTPTITGTVRVGHTLTAHPGTWGPGTVTHRYRWYANGAVISGATRSSLKLAPGQRGKTITVKVTGSKTGYTTVTKTSKATGKVR